MFNDLQRNPIRNLLMHGFHLIVATLCVNNVQDTQCGFKLFDRTAAKIVFAPLHIERWAFDVELLFIAARRKLAVKVCYLHSPIESRMSLKFLTN
jgi:dolichyl-phosphate beta-glucosyltransferase